MNESLLTSLGLDITSFRNNIDQAMRLITNLSDSLNKAFKNTDDSGLKRAQDRIASLREGAIALSTTVTDALARLGNINTTLSRVTGLEQFTSGLRRASESAEKTEEEVEEVAKGAKKAAGETKKLKDNLDKSGNSAKSLARIISGIVISQTFYSLVGTLRSLVDESLQFALNMQQAQVAFSYLTDDVEFASKLFRDIQTYSLQSPFSASAVQSATRQLLAYGIGAESVLGVFSVLADTAAVFSSNSSEINSMLTRVTLALGQIRAAGKLTAQEVRQLYNAGIPVYDILIEELQLTGEEVRNIGDLSIDSATAIQALLNGLQKRYSGAAQDFARTTTGALSVIRDSFLVTFNLIIQGPLARFTETINLIADAFVRLVTITRAYGVGGLFQALFPNQIQESLRVVIGSLLQLGSAIRQVAGIIGGALSGAIGILIKLLGLVINPISTLINLFAHLARAIYETIPPVRIFVQVLTALLIARAITISFEVLGRVILRLGIIFGKLTTYIVQLYQFFVRFGVLVIAGNPIAIGLLGIAAALTVLFIASEKVRNSLQSLFSVITNFSTKLVPEFNIGFDPNEFLQPEFVKDAQDYEGQLNGIADAFGNIGDAADDAQKKIKNNFNQSFDEVYLIDPNAADDLGITGDWTDLLTRLGEIQTALDGLALTGDFWKDWEDLGGKLELPSLDWDKFIEDLGGWETIITEALVVLLATAIAAVLGAPLIGLALGALAVWLVNLFWDEISEWFNLRDKADAFAIIIAGELAFLLSHFLKVSAAHTAIFIAIAAIGTWLNTQIGYYLEENLEGWDQNSSWILKLGGLIGAALGFVFAGPAGAAIGLGITSFGTILSNRINNALAEAYGLEDWEANVYTLFTLIAAALGFAVGGPAGALVLAALAEIGLWIGQGLRDAFLEGDYEPLTIAIGAVIGNAIGFVAFGPVGAAIGTAIGALVGWIVSRFIETFESWEWEFSWTNLKKTLEDFGLSWGLLFDNIILYFIGFKDKLFAQLFDLFFSWLFEQDNFFTNVLTDIALFIAQILEFFGILPKGTTKALKAVREEGIPELNQFEREGITSVKGFTDQSLKLTDSWAVNIVKTVADAISNILGWFDKLFNGTNRTVGASVSVNTSGRSMASNLSLPGHQLGGIFGTEHVARIAEGGRQEAIIPLQNAEAMKPFSDAVGRRIGEVLLPALANNSNNYGSNNAEVTLVNKGTIVGDKRTIRQFARLINEALEEERRRG